MPAHLIPSLAETRGFSVTSTQAMPQSQQNIAIFIDGGFFLKCLPKLNIPRHFHDTPKAVARTAYELCKQHVLRIVGRDLEEDGQWLRFAYRFFYYDAWPYEGFANHPITNGKIAFSETREARFRRELFEHLRRMRKFAVRLGHVDKAGGWKLRDERKFKRLLQTRKFAHLLGKLAEDGTLDLHEIPEGDRRFLANLAEEWRSLEETDVNLELRQKGVDMRLGMDIASIVLKKQANTLVLVTGDSDFVPAAKLARREGAEVILDPLWRNIRPALHEHIDGLYSVLGREQTP